MFTPLMCTVDCASDVAIGPTVACKTWIVGASRVATAMAVGPAVALPLWIAETSDAAAAMVGGLGGGGDGLHAIASTSHPDAAPTARHKGLADAHALRSRLAERSPMDRLF